MKVFGHGAIVEENMRLQRRGRLAGTSAVPEGDQRLVEPVGDVSKTMVYVADGEVVNRETAQLVADWLSGELGEERRRWWYYSAAPGYIFIGRGEIEPLILGLN